jgi:cyanophycinase
LEGDVRGFIIPVGGAESKIGSPLILKRFVRLCGGRDARIVVIPTASSLADTGERYEALFRELGAKRVDILDSDPCRCRRQAGHGDAGASSYRGNQHGCTTLGNLGARTIRQLNAAGYMAGTSAGASLSST